MILLIFKLKGIKQTAFINYKYEYISYDCTEVINDLEDLKNQGFKGNIIYYYSWENGVKIFKDYDLVTYGSTEELSVSPRLLKNMMVMIVFQLMIV